MQTEQLLAFAEEGNIDDMYVLVRWPHVEPLMEYHWFDPECYKFKSFGFHNAYFVPLWRILKIKEPG